MNRRNFLRAVAALPLAVVPLAFLAEPPLRIGQLGTYKGFTFHEGKTHTWKGPKAQLHNLPRYNFIADTDSGIYLAGRDRIGFSK